MVEDGSPTFSTISIYYKIANLSIQYGPKGYNYIGHNSRSYSGKVYMKNSN